MALSVALLGCAEPPLARARLEIEGVWQLTETGASESTIRPSEDGTFVQVAADLCRSLSGRWRVGEGSLTLEVTMSDGMPSSGSESDSVPLDANGLRLTHVASTGLYDRATSMPSCVD